jgi:hypothetical protein
MDGADSASTPERSTRGTLSSAAASHRALDRQPRAPARAIGVGMMVQDNDPASMVSQREARLRLEAAKFYPKLVPDRWVRAAALVPVVIRERSRNGVPWLGEGRVLPEQHFEFRGAAPRGLLWTGLLTRLTDG